MLIVNLIYFLALFFVFRYAKRVQIENMSKWTMPIAFSVKAIVGIFFSYVYIYSFDKNCEPSDAVRFLDESKRLKDVFYVSKLDFFHLLTGFGETPKLAHTYLSKSFLWNAGNFSIINDSKNVIRANTLIQFISFGSSFVHILIFTSFSLIGIQQIHKAIQPHVSINSTLLFYSLILFPTLLFWASSPLKEPILILGIGLLIRSLLLKDRTHKRIIIGTIGFVLLLSFKPYIIYCAIPSLLFIFLNNCFNKQKIIKSLTILFLGGFIILFYFNTERQKLTEYISRKQFDLENVGKGGIHVYGPNCFYYFKPENYKNFLKKDAEIRLIHPSFAYKLSYDLTQIPEKIYLKPTLEKWKIHIIMPGTSSYFKTTEINNSFAQLIKNIPEALVNTNFRPYLFEKGSTLKYLSIIEIWSLFSFLGIAIYKRKKLNYTEIKIILSLLIFIFFLSILIGWTTPISGAIVRFRLPIQLAFICIGSILIDFNKIKLKKNE